MIESITAKTFLFSTEAIVFSVLTFLLWMFYQGLGRQYVKFWMLSLASITVVLIVMAIDAYTSLIPETSPVKIFIAWLLQVSDYLFLAFFSLGVYAAKTSKQISANYIVYSLLLAVGIGTFATFLFATDPQHVFDRFFLRHSLRAFIFGCAFLAIASFLIWHKPHHFSSKIFTYLSLVIAVKMLLFSFSSTLALTEWWFQYVLVFSSYFDLAAVAVLGFVMLIWMQGAERNAAAIAMTKVQYLGQHDSLTGTMNRAQVLEKLPAIMDKVTQKQNRLCVALIDIKRFKFINDTYGLKAGDYILGEVANRLRESIFKPLIVGRTSGDSFVLVIEYSDERQVDHVCSHIHEIIARPFKFDKKEVIIQCSLGYCCFPEYADTAENLLQNANLALFHGESQNIASTKFSDEMQVQGRHLLIMEKAIKEGLNNSEFELYYQPQLNLLTNKLEGVEALVRWNHPEQGLLSPDKFLSDVEALGLNSRFDVYILEKACQAHRRWVDNYNKRVAIAVNMTAVEFQDPRLISTIQALLLKYQMSPTYLELEITENVVMTDVRSAMDTIVILQNMGIKVSIDDFGTGYSSLAYLRALPIDKIKIDRSFIKEMASNDSDVTIVKSMIKLSHALGKRVLAEGVETASQLDMLRKLGCDAVQGYYISKPVSETILVNHLTKK